MTEINEIDELITKTNEVTITNLKKINNIELFKKKSNYDNKTHTSNFVNIEKCCDEYASLSFGNGGSWSRFDSNFGKKYKVVSITYNNKIRFSWVNQLLMKRW